MERPYDATTVATRPYRIVHEREPEVLCVMLEGEITQARGAAAAHGCGILYDMRRATRKGGR